MHAAAVELGQRGCRKQRHKREKRITGCRCRCRTAVCVFRDNPHPYTAPMGGVCVVWALSLPPPPPPQCQFHFTTVRSFIPHIPSRHPNLPLPPHNKLLIALSHDHCIHIPHPPRTLPTTWNPTSITSCDPRPLQPGAAYLPACPVTRHNNRASTRQPIYPANPSIGVCFSSFTPLCLEQLAAPAPALAYRHEPSTRFAHRAWPRPKGHGKHPRLGPIKPCRWYIDRRRTQAVSDERQA